MSGLAQNCPHCVMCRAYAKPFLAILPLQGVSAFARADRSAGLQHAARNPDYALTVLARCNVRAQETAE